MNKGKLKPLAEKYIRDNKEMPNRSLAKLMFSENPTLFLSVDAARSVIRNIRGANGNGKGVKDLIRTKAEIDAWKNYLPKSYNSGFGVYHLTASVDLKYLFINDLHAHYQDNRILRIIIQRAIEEKCNAVYINGDLIDFYQISKFARNPTKKPIQTEIDAVGKILQTLKRALNPLKIVWKFGNHEQRFEHFLYQRAPELVGLNVLKTQSLFELKDDNIEIIPANNPARFGALNILHGTEVKQGIISPVNAARGIFLKTHECTIVGHSHSTSQHTEATVSGRDITCWSVGCACELHPEYAPINKYNHGFGILRTESTGYWDFKNYRIIKDMVV